MGIIEDAIDNRKRLFFYYVNVRGEEGKFIATAINLRISKEGIPQFKAIINKSRVKRNPNLPPPSYVNYERELGDPIIVNFTINRMSEIRYPNIWDYLLFGIIW